MIASGARSPPKRERRPSAGATITMPTNSSASLTWKEIRFLPDIPPLETDGNNLILWKFRVEMALSLQDLWGVVDGTDEMPDGATTDPKALADWKSRDLKARAQITLAFKDEPLKSVLDATTARECWKGVSEYCRRTAIRQSVPLIRKLFQTALSDTKPLEPQIQELLWAARMPSNASFRFPDNWIAMSIIMSLPPFLSTLRNILFDTEDSELSSRYVWTSNSA